MLTEMGHAIIENSAWSQAAGIMIGSPWLGGASRNGNRFYGANDPRRNTGLALGY
jgi:gamma-glutamyltranspeptidase/glutathione hydrolase